MNREPPLSIPPTIWKKWSRSAAASLFWTGEKMLAQGTADELKAMIKNTETIRLEVPQISEDILKRLYELPHVYQGTYEDGMDDITVQRRQ